MALLKVFWTKTAVRQRNLIFEYWNNRNQSTEYSKKLRSKINSTLKMLKQYPRTGKRTDYKTVRQVAMGHYSLLYKFNTEQIVVVSFWDNRQDPEKLLILLQHL
jgi:plasmid stabilization system protein ParE